MELTRTTEATRSDGDVGKSILPQIVACSHIPKSLPGCPVSVDVRGELMIKRSTILELNAWIVARGGKPYVSTRNLVAGAMKLRDMAEVAKRQVRFIPWEMLGDLLDNP